jgi:hypothetical protein
MLSQALAALITLALPVTAPPHRSAVLQAASASLAGKAQCVRFEWLPNDQGSPKGAITVPATLNGRALRLQLDTGSDANFAYGRLAQTAGWAKAGDEVFRAKSFEIAGTALDRPKIYIKADMEEDAHLQGTLGMPALVGKVAVLDYPGQRFCVFAEADLPAPLTEGTWVRGGLRNSRFYIPVEAGAFKSDAMVFDTGSSELPLNVDLSTWKTITGRNTVAGAPASFKGSAWGKPVEFPGAPSAAPVKIGEATLGRPNVFTDPTHPDGFTEWSVRTDGVVGNAPMWDGIVVLDLTARMRFGLIQ